MAQDRVMVLKFETFDVDEEVMSSFYRTLNDRLRQHPDKELVSGGGVTVNEMLITLGCEGITPKCLVRLKDFVEGDQLIFGSVERSEDINLFTLHLFDMNRGEFIASIEEHTVQGNYKEVKEAIPGLVDSLLYGNVGALRVMADGAEGAAIFLDGEKVGQAPADLDGLPLGKHTVMLRTSDGEEQTREVILEKGDQAELAFHFASAPPLSSEGSSPNMPRIAGIALIGVGVIGAVYGGVHRLRINDMEDEVDSKSQGFGVSSEELARLHELEDEIDDAYTRFSIGVGVGAGALALGTGLLILSGRGGAETAGLQLHVSPSRRGAHARLSLSF